MTLAYIAGLLAIFVVMFFVCQELERACGAIAHRLKIPESVSGATLLAISSSSPEFFTAFIGAVIFGEFEIGLMAIIWSAIFNITVIPGVCAVASKKPLDVVRIVVSRDCVAYLAITLLLLGLLDDGKLTRLDALILLGAYTLYVYVLYLMVGTYENGESESIVMPIWRMIGSLLLGMAVIGGLCHGMIWLGEELAHGWEIDIILFSALVFAPGTSIPDLLLSVFSARRGAGSAAISNAYGSNSFDLTVCLAVPILVVGEITVPLSGRVLWSIWMLLGTLILSIMLLRSGYNLNRREGGALLVLFVILAAIIIGVPPA